MQKLSEEAKLSKPYTNHCIRATCITNLDDNDIETRHIMGLSGHKSESAIRSYTKRLSEKKKRQMSDILINCTKSNVEPQPKVCRQSINSEVIETQAADQDNSIPDLLGDDIEFEAVLKEIQNYENNENQTSINKNSVNQTSNESSVSLMNNNVPEVVTNCTSNTFQKFQLPQGFAIQNNNNSNISFHFHQ